jgi:Coenzyme PQQ synthesis protein D (PqqD)
MTSLPRYRASESGLLTELGDGTGVLLDMQSNFYFSFNETAIFVWRLLSAAPGKSRDELVAALAAEFEVQPEQAGGDVDALLDLLKKERLVHAE